MYKKHLLLSYFHFINTLIISCQFFGGINNDKGIAFCELNKGIVLTGTTRSFGEGSEDIWLVKVNEDFIYQNAIEWGSVHHDISSDIISTVDGGIVVLGYSWDAPGARTGIVLAKYDSSLSNQWTSYFSGTSNDLGYSLIQTSDNGFLAVGIDKSVGEIGACSVIKVNENGVLEWQQFYDTENKDIGIDVLELNDGSIFTLINSSSFEGKLSNSSDYLSNEASHLMLIKSDNLGNEIWRKFYGNQKHSFGKKIISDGNGDFLIVGSSLNNTNGSFDIILRKIDPSGIVIWRKNFGGNGYEYGNNITVSPTGEILLTGYSNSFTSNLNPDLFAIKTDNNGEEVWSLNFGGENAEYGNDGIFLEDGNIALLGTTKSTIDGNENILLIKTSPNGEILDTLNSSLTFNNPVPLIYPNPAFSNFNIFFGHNSSTSNFKFTMFDLNGKVVINKLFDQILGNVTIDHKIKSGIYLYEINGNGLKHTGKLIIN